MTFSEAMREYYSGQRFVALAGALVATFYLIVARVAYIRAAQSARSFAITIFLIAGCFMLPANVVYFFSIGPQSARIDSILTRSQAEFDTLETIRLNKMMDGFRFSYRIDGAVALLGLFAAAVGFAVKSNKAIGAGIALTLCATTLLAGRSGASIVLFSIERLSQQHVERAKNQLHYSRRARWWRSRYSVSLRLDSFHLSPRP